MTRKRTQLARRGTRNKECIPARNPVRDDVVRTFVKRLNLVVLNVLAIADGQRVVSRLVFHLPDQERTRWDRAQDEPLGLTPRDHAVEPPGMA